MTAFQRYIAGIFVALVTLSLTACSDNEPPLPNLKTLLVYFPWSTNLTSNLYDNVSDLERAILNNGGLKQERVVVFLAQDATHAWLFEIVPDKTECNRFTIKDYEDIDCTTEANLTQILSDMASAAPAETYGLLIGGHGAGWLPRGCFDRSTTTLSQAPAQHQASQPLLTRYFGGKTGEYQTDISTLNKSLTNCGLHLDFILFDNCYMSTVEVAYELRNVTNYIIASPTEIMAYGLPYSKLGMDLMGETNYQAICNKFYSFYATYEYPWGALAVIDCHELDTLASRMKEVRRYLTDSPTDELYSHTQRMDGYNPTIFYDLQDYVNNFCANKTARDNFIKQLNKAIPYKCYTNYFYSANINDTIKIERYSGITTSAPSFNSKANTWNQTSWAIATLPSY